MFYELGFGGNVYYLIGKAVGFSIKGRRRREKPCAPAYCLEAELTAPDIQHYFYLMGFIEFFSICIAVLAVYGIVTCIRCLLPRNIIPTVSTLLNDAKQCVTSAETTGAIPGMSEYRASLETYGTLHLQKSSSH